MKHCFLAAALVLGIAFLGHGAADGHGLRRSCEPTQKIILQVCHPCTGCKYDVEVCVPACCAVEAPRVCFEKTLIGHGKTVFEWRNGTQVVVRYPHGGGYRVIQRG